MHNDYIALRISCAHLNAALQHDEVRECGFFVRDLKIVTLAIMVKTRDLPFAAEEAINFAY